MAAALQHSPAMVQQGASPGKPSPRSSGGAESILSSAGLLAGWTAALTAPEAALAFVALRWIAAVVAGGGTAGGAGASPSCPPGPKPKQGGARESSPMTSSPVWRLRERTHPVFELFSSSGFPVYF